MHKKTHKMHLLVRNPFLFCAPATLSIMIMGIHQGGRKKTEKKTHQNFPLKQMTTRSIGKSL